MKNAILSNLPAACPWRDTLHWYDTIDSTNTRAKQLAAQGAPEGTVVIAGQQSAGRGRLGRSFHSPAGKGLYLSLILRPQCAPEQLMHLTCATAVAACNAAEEVTGYRPKVKWINDLVCQKQKLGGILTELSIDPQSGKVDYAIIGIGINCNHRREDFPSELREIATSLQNATGSPCPVDRLAAALISQLFTMSRELLCAQGRIMAQYRADCMTLGQQILVLRAEEKRYGTAEAVLDDGSLLVTYSDGHREAVSSGEVSVRGMYGYI